MNDRDSVQEENLFKRMAALQDHAGIDTEQSAKINADALDWLASLVKTAKETKLETSKAVECPECQKKFKIELMDFEKATKAAGNLVKVLDINARLNQFIQGKEDSRPGGSRGGDSSVLKCLTPEQLTILNGWLIENQGVER